MITTSKLFRIALTHREMTATAFAKKHGVSRQSVYDAIENPQSSQRIREFVDAFIQDAMKDLHIRLDAIRQNGNYGSYKNNALQA